MILAQPQTAAGSRILGLGAYRPAQVVTNAEICGRIESTEEWIVERSGIQTRHFARASETVVDMAEHACAEALQESGIGAAEVDLVLLATITHMLQTPAAAPMVADRIGATRAPAVDISAACAGFSYGIGMANDAIRGGSARHVLVVGVEKMSDVTDFDDRSTAFIFGDGAGAVLMGGCDTPAVGPTVWGADGGSASMIQQNEPWTALRTDPGVAWPTLRMAGQSVFRWAVWQMAPVARKAVEAAGVTLEDLGAFVPHQANARIVDALAKQLKLPDHVLVARDIVTSGNTSSASIPLAMHRLRAENPQLSGQLALTIGFGAGLTYAAQVVQVP